MATIEEIRAIALTEANKMSAVVAQAVHDDVSVTMKVSQFRLLSTLLERLACAREDIHFEAKCWVPLPEFEKVKKRLGETELEALLLTF